MVRRKRLSPATALTGMLEVAPDAKSTTPPPIASVVGDAAGRSELLEAADAHRTARAEGRLIVDLLLEAIDPSHLVRDRMVTNDTDMEALKSSIKARGQQTPIEVEDLGNGYYGLISGWRRLEAMKALQIATGEPRFGKIKSLIKDLSGVSDAYIAMVEENEVRANLSFYERARIAEQAAERGVFPTAEIAVRELFRSASRPKRSKILSFLLVHRTLKDVLRFPTALTERQGLKLARALGGDPEAEIRVRNELAALKPNTAECEINAAIDAATGPPFYSSPSPKGVKPNGPAKPAPRGIILKQKGDRVELVGQGIDTGFVAELKAWLEARDRN